MFSDIEAFVDIDVLTFSGVSPPQASPIRLPRLSWTVQASATPQTLWGIRLTPSGTNTTICESQWISVLFFFFMTHLTSVFRDKIPSDSGFLSVHASHFACLSLFKLNVSRAKTLKGPNRQQTNRVLTSGSFVVCGSFTMTSRLSMKTTPRPWSST